MNTKFLAASLALALGAGTAASAFEQAKPEVLVKQRQAAMTLQGKYFGPLGAMAQGKAPYNAELVAHNAAFLDVLTKMPWDAAWYNLCLAVLAFVYLTYGRWWQRLHFSVFLVTEL